MSGSTLVTGAGLMGCLTARALADRGGRVMLLDRNPQHEAIADIAGGPNVTVVAGDVTDLPSLRVLVQAHGVQGIVHTAALLSTAIRRSPLDGVRVNAMGTANVLEVARELGLQRVVIASSATVGYPSFGEFAGAAFPEDFPLRSLAHRPMSIYAATKCFSEHLGLLYRDLHGVEVVALRYAAVIGAWRGPETSVPGRLLSTLFVAARRGEVAVIDDPLLTWRGGEEFVDARDCATANVTALEAASPAQGVYNVGSGVAHTFDDVVAAVRALHPDLRVRMDVEPSGGFAGFVHVRPAPSDIAAAARELGWSPRHRLCDSVCHYAPWYA